MNSLLSCTFYCFLDTVHIISYVFSNHSLGSDEQEFKVGFWKGFFLVLESTGMFSQEVKAFS